MIVVEPLAIQAADTVVALEDTIAVGEWTPRTTQAFLCSPSTRGWVALQAGQHIGHIIASVAGDVGEVVTIAVHPSARRQGVAGTLLRRLRKQWLHEGVCEAFLEVRHDNTAAIGLYGRYGWGEVGRRERYYKDGADAIVMRLELST